MSIQEINDRHLERVREINREYSEGVEAINKKYDEEVGRIWRRAFIAMTVLLLIPIMLLLVAMYAADAATT